MGVNLNPSISLCLGTFKHEVPYGMRKDIVLAHLFHIAIESGKLGIHVGESGTVFTHELDRKIQDHIREQLEIHWSVEKKYGY